MQSQADLDREFLLMQEKMQLLRPEGQEQGSANETRVDREV